MGLIDHLLHGGDDPAALLRDHPSVLLPKNAADDEVAGLLRSWSPTADTSGHGQEVIGGIRWYGPIPLDDKLIDAASLPSGFVEAYVARCHRSRALRSSASRRLFQWGQRFTDSRLGLDPTVTAETMADVEADRCRGACLEPGPRHRPIARRHRPAAGEPGIHPVR